MTRMNILLALGLIGSSLLLVSSSYETRRLFSSIERAKAEERQLESEYKRLDAERQVQATHLRVERVARERLQMRTVTPAVTHWVAERPPGPPPGATVVPPTAERRSASGARP